METSQYFMCGVKLTLLSGFISPISFLIQAPIKQGKHIHYAKILQNGVLSPNI